MFVVGTNEPRRKFERPTQIIGRERGSGLDTHDLASPEAIDEPPAPLARRKRKQLSFVTVEEAEQPSVNLTHVVLDNTVELRRQVIVGKGRRQLHYCGKFRAGKPSIDTSDGLIPEKLNRISVLRHPVVYLGGPAQGRSVRTGQVLRGKRAEVVNASEQDPGIAVLLATNRKHIEQRRPNEVVNRKPERWEPERHGVIGVGWCRGDVHLQSGHVDRAGGIERLRRLDVTGGEGCVGGGPEELAEPNVERAIGALGGELERELLDQTARIGRTDLRRGARPIGGDTRMTPDRNRPGRVLIENSPSARHVVEVGVHHGNDRRLGNTAKLTKCVSHLLHRLPGVDGNNPFRALNEGLVRQPVSNETPDPRAEFVKPTSQPFAVGDVLPMGDATVGQRDGIGRRSREACAR